MPFEAWVASEVELGVGVLGRLARADVPASSTALIADARALELHGDKLGALCDAPTLRLAQGEGAKTFAELERVLEFLAERELDRHCTLFAFGGGATSDVVGLAAALYLRGVEWEACPTTLLAQVDAAIGGKTAINLAAGKNLAGAFHAPRRVWIDPRVLSTLPESEFRSGLGEVVKSALLAPRGFFEYLEGRHAAIRAREEEPLTECVRRAIEVKQRIVARDPREQGERALLNLGHTFAHAIERVAGFGALPHGAAVSVGLVLALEASRRTGLLSEPELQERTERLLAAWGLPRSLPELEAAGGRALDRSQLRAAMSQDKKRRASRLRFVLLEGLGRARLGVELDESILGEVLARG